jgi:DNA replication protein
MACAFGIAACQNFYTVKYIRLPELLIELDIARNEGSYKKLMNQYRKFQLLILDEWMLISLKENEARDVLEIVHARHHKGSTIFCSQFSPAGWHAKIGEATLPMRFWTVLFMIHTSLRSILIRMMIQCVNYMESGELNKISGY